MSQHCDCPYCEVRMSWRVSDGSDSDHPHEYDEWLECWFCGLETDMDGNIINAVEDG